MKKIVVLIMSLSALVFSSTFDLKYGDDSFLNGSWDVFSANDAGYIIAGYTTLYGNDTFDANGYLIKTDSLGTIEWEKVLNGEGADVFVKVKQTSDGGYIVLGQNNYFVSETVNVCKPWLIKYDETGKFKWEKTYDELGSIYGVSDLIIAQDGGFLILGSKKTSPSQYYDIWLMKADTHGKKLWEQVYDYGHNDRGACIVKSLDSGYFIVSDTELYYDSELKYQLWAMNVDESGNVNYDNIISFSSDSKICYSLCSTEANSYMISGFTNIEIDPRYGWTGAWGPFILKFKLYNSLEWIQYFESTSRSICDTGNNSIISLGSPFSEMSISKIDYSGNLIWSRQYDSKSDDYGTCVIANLPDNSLVFTGTVDRLNLTSKVNLIKTDSDGYVIYPPTITSFENDSNNVSINWEAVSNAGSYIVYGSDRPDSNFTAIDTTTVNLWNSAAVDSLKKKFYYIKASTSNFSK